MSIKSKTTTDIVCDRVKIPESDTVLLYVRKVTCPEEVEQVRQNRCTMLVMQRTNAQAQYQEKLPVYPRSDIALKLSAGTELGEFTGLYLENMFGINFPEIGFTYVRIPDTWERVNNPAEKKIGKTNLGELVQQRWWRKVPGYEKG